MLNEKQRRFVAEYLIDLNATKAAMRAGYSAVSAHAQGCALLKHREISAELAKASDQRAAKTSVDADWLLKRLADESTADLADIYDRDTGNLKQIHDWPLIWRQGLVQGVEREELFEGRGEEREQIGHVVKVRLDNRVRRLELIGKHIAVGAFAENVNVTVRDEFGDRLDRAIARKEGKGA